MTANQIEPMPVRETSCRLFLILAADTSGDGLERLEAALAAAGEAIACVLLRWPAGAAQGRGELAAVIARAHGADVAVLLDGDAELARELGADGVHLPPVDDEEEARRQYALARAALGSEQTVGASAGLSKHMAMVLGEIGADYVAFEGAGAGELARWWTPLFEVPAVAMGVERAVEAEELAAAGVDFLGVALEAAPVGTLARRITEFTDAIAAVGAAP